MGRSKSHHGTIRKRDPRRPASPRHRRRRPATSALRVERRQGTSRPDTTVHGGGPVLKRLPEFVLDRPLVRGQGLADHSHRGKVHREQSIGEECRLTGVVPQQGEARVQGPRRVGRGLRQRLDQSRSYLPPVRFHLLDDPRHLRRVRLHQPVYQRDRPKVAGRLDPDRGQDDRSHREGRHAPRMVPGRGAHHLRFAVAPIPPARLKRRTSSHSKRVGNAFRSCVTPQRAAVGQAEAGPGPEGSRCFRVSHSRAQ